MWLTRSPVSACPSGHWNAALLLSASHAALYPLHHTFPAFEKFSPRRSLCASPLEHIVPVMAVTAAVAASGVNRCMLRPVTKPCRRRRTGWST